MKLPDRLVLPLWRALFRYVAMRRPADFAIGGVADPYMLRWYLLGARKRREDDRSERSRSFLGVAFPYLHCFRRSDDDRALHDHPAPSFSICLGGSAVEVTIDGRGLERRRRIERGDVILRSAAFAHRIEIEPGVDCWTLFVFGPRIREWGFLCPQGWRHWKEFTAPGDPGSRGRGCE